MDNHVDNEGDENGRTGGGGGTTTVDQGAVRNAVQEILIGIPGMSALMDTGVTSLVASQATGRGAGERKNSQTTRASLSPQDDGGVNRHPHYCLVALVGRSGPSRGEGDQSRYDSVLPLLL